MRTNSALGLLCRSRFPGHALQERGPQLRGRRGKNKSIRTPLLTRLNVSKSVFQRAKISVTAVRGEEILDAIPLSNVEKKKTNGDGHEGGKREPTLKKKKPLFAIVSV